MNKVITILLDRGDTADVISGNGNKYILAIGEFDSVLQIEGEPETLLAIADCINKIVPRWKDEAA